MLDAINGVPMLQLAQLHNYKSLSLSLTCGILTLLDEMRENMSKSIVYGGIGGGCGRMETSYSPHFRPPYNKDARDAPLGGCGGDREDSRACLTSSYDE